LQGTGLGVKLKKKRLSKKESVTASRILFLNSFNYCIGLNPSTVAHLKQLAQMMPKAA
jgi:hypothetical protein